MTTKRRTPLLYPAATLSAASLAWTTWSLVDLLGAGLIGITVAAGADIIWASVIIAEYRGLRVAGRNWIVPAIGWATLLAVAAFLTWHGIARDALAMAAAGPFLPLGAKAVWTLALADMRDPAALTDDELHALAEMERGMAFEEARHRIEMRRREMGAELQLAEVSTDFDIELTRQDRARELYRRRPLELTVSGHQTDTPDKAPDTSGQADTGPDTPADNTPPASPDTRPDKADALRTMAAAASGPAELIRTLSAHGIPKDTLVSEAIRLRPDMLPDSIRRTAKRLGEGPYL